MRHCYEDGGLTLFHGSNKDVLPTLEAESFDSVVTDPPYELGFMGKGWDSSGIAYDVEMWRECWRVLKPGGHLLAFGGTRTWHRIATAIEDAGFEIRDSMAWLYGSGFPKSMDVSKAITATQTLGGSSRTLNRRAMTGDDSRSESFGSGPQTATTTATSRPPERANLTPDAQQWEGWGTALKPAFEPIIVARKPLVGTVAANVLKYGTGALNIDASRIGTNDVTARVRTRNGAMPFDARTESGKGTMYAPGHRFESETHAGGRFPSNVLLDDSQAVALNAADPGAARYFPTFRYEAKAPGSERPEVDGVAHATVKPLDLMRWLVRLVTHRGGRVLDPFAGSGTTGEAALLEGMNPTLIELEEAHLPLILQRVRKPLQPSMFGDWEQR